MSEVTLELEYDLSIADEAAALGRPVNDDDLKGRVVDLISERCGNESAVPGSVTLWAHGGCTVAARVTFDVDGDDELELYEAACENLLPKGDGGLDADGGRIVAAMIDGVRLGGADLEALVSAPSPRP